MNPQIEGADQQQLIDALWLAQRLGPQYLPAVLAFWLAMQPQHGEPGLDPITSSSTSEDDDGPGGQASPGANEPYGSNVYTDDNAATSTGFNARRIHLLSVPALRQANGLARALRPLKQLAAAPGRSTVDERRTAEATADARRMVPVFQPSKERWLELALVVDDSQSMGMWRQTAREFRALLERQGAFRNVRTWHLSADEDGRPVLSDPSGQCHQPEELSDPTGRRLILLFSDAVDDLWRTEKAVAMLRAWVANNPMAMIQVLPSSMWHRTALPAVPVDLRHLRPGIIVPVLPRDQGSNRDRHSGVEGGPDRLRGPWIPTMELDEAQLTSWAQLLVGHDLGPTSGMAVPVYGPPTPRPVADERDVPIRERVARFQASASSVAFDLAGYLAAAPLTLPVMRVVQRAALPESEPGHLAEVLLSGLIERVTAADEDPDQAIYDFLPEARDQLLGTRTRRQAIAVLDALVSASADVAGRLGTVDISALAADPAGHLLRNADSRAFAKVAVTVLGGLGGTYADKAEEIDTALRRSVRSRRGGTATMSVRRAEPRQTGPLPSDSYADDPAAPIFFLSYARGNPSRSRRPVADERVRKVFEDLSENVSQLYSFMPGQEPGFMDATVSGSREWETALLRAAGSSQVFVALLSTPYVESSPWCAAEWDLFSRRPTFARARRGEPGDGAILPVLWSPVIRPVPPQVAAIQRFAPTDLHDPTVGARYQKDGLLGLLQTDEEAYHTIIWKLALHVQRTHALQWVRPEILTDASGLRKEFGRSRPTIPVNS